MKKILIFFALIILLSGCSLFQSKNSNTNQPVSGEQEKVRVALTQIFATKNNKPVAETQVTVTKLQDDFASGSISFGPTPGEGGGFLARLADDSWTVDYEGNGSIDCVKIRQLGYPEEVLTGYCDPVVACQKSSDCQLPMDYAVLSSCPYQAYCYQQKCVVGCPLWEDQTNQWKVECLASLDCDCTAWDPENKYTCACVDGQCASIVNAIASPEPQPSPVACTQEAKLCPDGTSVGRTGPNCEFSDCPLPAPTGDNKSDCRMLNGSWLDQYQECEGISQNLCQYLGGVFSECESACRHDPQAEVCTMQCVPVCKFNSFGLSETEAQAIAEKTCIKGGESLAPGNYNAITKTWWFDANLNAAKEGCNPACVVDETTKTAEINWRCTGLIVPGE